ncbi:DUF1993 family protein [Rugamonas sp. FT107W]|uniref:DUF1993 family protein n=1 Tax=Duganella vulcania TaxID=2692166 RepID=A0A845HI76_9BURK|nr:DUF1993 domain-containing protein [Duganella vulcania]MYN16346.1 DUF1993 family protein [Duganella vulcania]
MHASIIFIRYLGRLAGIVEKAKAGPEILTARLHAEMLPFASQVRATCNFALRGCCPLAGLPPVSFDGAELSFAALSKQLDDTIAYIAAIPPQQFEGPADRLCRDRAGFADIELPADEYLNLYILPNFYFHFSMAYAIARSQGADIGKQDFDGYHLYAPGFSFERPAA